MAGIHDQASAIWKALDQMSAKDPDAYKKFIEEQMEESKKFFASAKKSGGDAIEKMVKLEGKKCPVNAKMEVFKKAPKSSTDLTDDAFTMTSLLTSICPEIKKEDEDESEILEELKIPVQTKMLAEKGKSASASGEKKRLIEEL